ncbi:peptide chain release factor 2 [Mycoplasmatota bacterium]|nr:peptide chain release factor 2 [Mycoplasmatota bacterium]
MEKYEINKYINIFQNKINAFTGIIDLDKQKNIIKELETKMSDINFWNDSVSAKKTVNELNNAKEKISGLEEVIGDFNEILEFIELDDESLHNDLVESILSLDELINKLEISILLSDKYDSNNAILEIHPGAGGTESQDWARMLYDMYLKYTDKKKFKVEVIDYINDEKAGLKSVSLLITGKDAYGYLKSEAGVHRLIRISPFDSNSRRHTSFASVDVTPEIDDSITIDINEDDLRIDTFRASGAGGQHINTTDSAVRIKHIPTGLTVSCQSQRSQLANRKKAMDLLKAKIYKLREDELEENLKNISGEKMEIGWGSQIRSYVLHPYSLVKDHRTNYEVGNPDKVLNGELDDFINEYLRNRAR